NAVKYDQQLWPNGEIIYEISPGLRQYEQLILEAMRSYEDTTCIKFRRRFDEDDYVNIHVGDKCYSRVGKSFKGGPQPLSLGNGCTDFGTILHELGHSVGFDHEHSRTDRDEYLIIHERNIKNGSEHNFEKLLESKTRTIGPFDYDSIMLYGSYAFSRDTEAVENHGTRRTRTPYEICHSKRKAELL
nr:RecName: Full=Astacin-like metalloprotease toxin 5; AltName: Full=Loxosceles astacin-like protease 5; Short=LALP5 [Loxosceles gaucho]